MRTYSTKPSEIERVWYVVDAEEMVLGRLSTEVARILRGKHRPIFSPHLDTGDHVIVVNAAKIVMSSDKAEKSFDYRHSGYPGSLTATSYAVLLRDKPEELVRKSVKGMLPKGPLGRKMITKLKVYAGPEHPHAAQMPKVMDLPASARRAS
ncbi:MAG: 50S ribosomal protein L13 [Acidimicrobiales bacterium]